MINKIIPNSDNEQLCLKAFSAAISSYYYGENDSNENIKKLFHLVKNSLNKELAGNSFSGGCELDWGDDLLQIKIDVSNLSTTMRNFWYCIFAIVTDFSYLGRNYRTFADKIYFEILEFSIEKSVRESILEDWEPSEKDILFISELE